MRRIGFTAMLLLLSVSVAVDAAPGTSSAPTGDSRPAAQPATGNSPARRPVVLTGRDGKQIRLPADASLEGYLEYLRAGRMPAFGITSVVLEGTAGDETARLTATVTVQINREHVAVKVPLAMKEGTLQSTKYQGRGEATPGGYDRATGYLWWFQGKGRHQLTLTMLVPLQKQLPARRLLLAMPDTPVSSLKLTVPLQHLKATPPNQSSMKTKSLGISGSEIQLFGLGNRLDLSWQPLPTQQRSRTELQAETRIEVEPTTESVLLRADQKIRAIRGSLQEVTVRLPAGFELLDVKGKEYASHETLPDNLVTVRLTEPTSEPIELTWILEAAFPGDKGQLVLEGFDVRHARRQTGIIAVSELEGFRISARKGESRHVYRTNVNRADGNTRISSAYQFLSQPFRLTLALSEIEPGYTADARLRLHLSATQAELDGRFEFNVYRGAIQEIVLSWPRWASEGWTIEPPLAPGLIEHVEIDKRTDHGAVRIRLTDRRTGTFRISLKARRPLTPGGHPSAISLPMATVTSRSPAFLTLLQADNVVAELTPNGKTVSRAVADPPSENSDVPEAWRGLRRLDFRVDSAVRTFNATVTVHKQTVRAESSLSCQLRDRRLLVTQHMAYDVRYEPLQQVRLMIPASIAGEIVLSDGNGVPLTPNWTGQTSGTLKEARISPAEPKIGRTEIEARYFIALPSHTLPTGETLLAIPMIQSVAPQYASLKLKWTGSDRIQAAVTDPAWKQQQTTEGANLWVTSTADATVPLKLTYTDIPPTQHYVVHRALIRAVVDRHGDVRSQIRFRVDGEVSTLDLVVPDDAVVESVWWDRRKLDAGRIRTSAGNPERYRLRISDALERGSHLLTVSFHSRFASSVRWSERHTMNTPYLSGNAWVEQTLWDVVLPWKQYLFTTPVDFTPQFHWQRRTLLWDRQPAAAYSDLNAWIDAEDGPDVPAEFAEGNAYLFSRFGPARTIEFCSMSQSAVILFGAGLALAAGFVLLKIPATRNVLTLLTVIFAVALTSLWFEAPVKLLLQPALLGLLLAVVAAIIERSVKRRSSSILTLSTPADFVVQSPSSVSIDRPPIVAGSEDPTALRALPDSGPSPAGGAAAQGGSTPNGRSEPVSSSMLGGQP